MDLLLRVGSRGRIQAGGVVNRMEGDGDMVVRMGLDD